MSTRRRWVLVIAIVGVAAAFMAGGLRADHTRQVDMGVAGGTSDQVVGEGTASDVIPKGDVTEIWHPKPWPSPNLEWTPVVQLGYPATPPVPPTPCNPCP